MLILCAVPDMKRNGFVWTEAYGLEYCRHILHVNADKFISHNSGWKPVFTLCLSEANSRGFQAIALPAFGTGQQNSTIKSLTSFTFSNSCTAYCDQTFPYITKHANCYDLVVVCYSRVTVATVLQLVQETTVTYTFSSNEEAQRLEV